MSKAEQVARLMRRGLRDLENAWKCFRAIAEVEPNFFGHTGNDSMDSPHHHIKPYFQAIERIVHARGNDYLEILENSRRIK